MESPPLAMVPSGWIMREEENQLDGGTKSRSPELTASPMETKSTAWEASRKDAISLNRAQGPQSAS